MQVGNAALEGATIALVSPRARRGARVAREKSRTLPARNHPGFFDFFVDGCQFRPAESGSQVNG